jgi:hypothetical protein
MKPLMKVVGATTGSTSRILAVFDTAAPLKARLAYRLDDEKVNTIDAATLPAQPYRRVCFDLTDLT